MKRTPQLGGVGPLLRWVAWTCVVTVLLIGTMEATHIHKEWVHPAGSQQEVQHETSKDAQCVLCLTSHQACNVPITAGMDLLQGSTGTIQPHLPFAPMLAPAGAHFIRPPPTA